MRLARIAIGVALAALFALPAAAATQRRSAQKVSSRRAGAPGAAVSGSPAVKAIIAACGQRRFETSAEVMEAGHARVTKIKLCAKPGEDDATWIKSLQQAAKTIGAADSLPAVNRAKIVADLDAEIARVRAASGLAPATAGPPAGDRKP